VTEPPGLRLDAETGDAATPLDPWALPAGHGCACAAAIYGAFLLYERPGLGIGHFYYLPILLAALATGAGAWRARRCRSDRALRDRVLLNPAIASSEVLSASTAIRLVTFLAVGAVTGYFAAEGRRANAELTVLAERDAVTGLPNTRAFERAIGERLAGQQAFVLLVGALDADSAAAESSSLVNLVAERLIRALEPEDDLARIGHQEFAVIASLPRAEDARRLAAHLERALVGSGVGVTFGWATHPQDGDNALSLYRAADERLYARRVIRRNEPTVVALRRPAG
jgi:GGDEF domain-containing protein